jgi:hypothetical protein
VKKLIAAVERALPPGGRTDPRHREAGVVASQLVGTLQLARALGADEGRALLAASRRALLAAHDRDASP